MENSDAELEAKSLFTLPYRSVAGDHMGAETFTVNERPLLLCGSCASGEKEEGSEIE
jgi:hypothetical protein